MGLHWKQAASSATENKHNSIAAAAAEAANFGDDWSPLQPHNSSVWFSSMLIRAQAARCERASSSLWLVRTVCVNCVCERIRIQFASQQQLLGPAAVEENSDSRWALCSLLWHRLVCQSLTMCGESWRVSTPSLVSAPGDPCSVASREWRRKFWQADLSVRRFAP